MGQEHEKKLIKIVPVIILGGLIVFILYNVFKHVKNIEFTEEQPVVSQNAEAGFLQEPAIIYGVKLVSERTLQAEAGAEPAEEEKEGPGDSLEAQNREEGRIESGYGIILETQGYFENFPFPEINNTEWENDRLLCAEVSIEHENLTVNLGNDDIIVHFETPVLLGETPAIDKINKDLSEQYEAAWGEYKEWIDYLCDGCLGGVYVWDCFLSYNHDGVINFGISLQSGAGGPMSREVHSYTYDLNTGKRLNLAEILGVREENLQDVLLEAFTNSAEEEPENILWQVYTPEELMERLKEYTIDDFHYCINIDGEVDIWFAKYELMGGAEGMQAATIGSIYYGQP